MAPYKYKNLEDSIQKILAGTVTLKDEEKKKYNCILKEIFEILESEMRNDPAFDALFRQKQYVGSCYENLKIDMPDEFDIDFELEIPFYIGVLQVCSSEQPGFCQLKLQENTSSTSDPRKAAAKKGVMKWTDAEGFLSRSKVNQWMQSTVDRALTEYDNNYTEKTFKFNRSCSGPAVTLTVTLIKHPELRLSLDFVPVFVFQHWPRGIENLREWTAEMEEERWYAVPKSKSSDKDFRLSFWHQEKHLLSGTNQMKPILKLIKKLRDNQKWKGISSYYIKTMFLWKTDNHGKAYWCKGLGAIFIEMLTEFQEYLLKEKTLPFFWMKENDLLSELHPCHKEGVGRFLLYMIRDIEKNLDEPDYLLEYFPMGNRSMTTAVGQEDIIGAQQQRTVTENMESLQPQQQSNAATIAAIAVGAAAVLGFGLYQAFRGNRRTQE